jgi:O-antigen/teichoic acid export membrane protein
MPKKEIFIDFVLNQISNFRTRARNHKTIIGNFSYLSALSILNLLIPIATYPYLVRVLGKDTYGIIVFAQAIIGYMVILVSFGFNTSATKDISVNRHNTSKLNEIVSSVLIIKGVLFILSFIILLGVLFFIPQSHGYYLLFVLTMWLALYEFIFPVWYFQGIEKMKYITFFTLLSKLTFLVLIFIFIKSPDQYLRLPVINAIGSLLAGFASLYIVFVQDKIKFYFPGRKILRKYFAESFPLFISSVSVTIFVQANKIIIGTWVSMGEVASYDLAEKIVQLLKSPQMLITQAIFPKTSRDKNRSFIKKMMMISFLIGLVLFVLTQIFAYKIVTLLGGQQMVSAVVLLRFLSIAVILVYISQYTSVHTLLANGFNKIWMQLIIYSGLIYLGSVVILGLTGNISALHLVFSSLLSELYVLGSSYYYSKKHQLI